MHKKLHFLSLCALLTLGLLGCGEESTTGGQIGNHEKNLQANDFDVDAITWSVDNSEGLKIPEFNPPVQQNLSGYFKF